MAAATVAATVAAATVAAATVAAATVAVATVAATEAVQGELSEKYCTCHKRGGRRRSGGKQGGIMLGRGIRGDRSVVSN